MDIYNDQEFLSFDLEDLQLKKVCLEIRKDILNMTTKAGSGHLTSSLSAVELVACLTLKKFFRHPNYPSLLSLSTKERLRSWQNGLFDRLLFSKGHASPLFYSLYKQFGVLKADDLLTFRQFNSVLEGHPTPRFWPTEVTTGSLGQGLSIAAGLALGLRQKYQELKNSFQKLKLKIQTEQTSENLSLPKVFVLLGDSEMAEGSVWEAMNFASYYKLSNLLAIVDTNRLGQTGPTQHGHDLLSLGKKCSSFGWETLTVTDGHNLQELSTAYQKLLNSQTEKPKILIAKTFKGKGVKFLEDQNGWHGKVLDQAEYAKALNYLEI